MTLEEATQGMLAAIGSRDLERLADAIEARAAAIARGERPTLETVQSGEQAASTLMRWKQQLAFENTRLERLREVARTLSQRPEPRVSYRG
ncbi:MAG TPA: hypothetical protein VFW83_05075 [Bryobacteraceae bacterium]|nr:hypothetical protein [Bryobacteraceae bacterium]